MLGCRFRVGRRAGAAGGWDLWEVSWPPFGESPPGAWGKSEAKIELASATMRRAAIAALLLHASLVAAFAPHHSVRRRHAPLRGTFRDAQRELMDGGAEVELSGDALLAEAMALDFIAANVEMRSPRCVAGVAVKNAGRSIADVGAKFRNKGGLELAAYAMDEAGVYMGEAAKALNKLDDAGAAPASRAAAAVAGALSRTGKGLYEQCTDATGAGLLEAAAAYEALAGALGGVAALAGAKPKMVAGAARLRDGGDVLTGAAVEVAAPKKPRRW